MPLDTGAGGPAVVERARLKILYYDDADAQPGRPRVPDTEWILDMPRQGWDPYRLRLAPGASCDPADPLAPGQDYEFAVTHYGGGPHGWPARTDTTAVEVCEVRTRS